MNHVAVDIIATWTHFPTSGNVYLTNPTLSFTNYDPVFMRDLYCEEFSVHRLSLPAVNNMCKQYCIAFVWQHVACQNFRNGFPLNFVLTVHLQTWRAFSFLYATSENRLLALSCTSVRLFAVELFSQMDGFIWNLWRLYSDTSANEVIRSGITFVSRNLR